MKSTLRLSCVLIASFASLSVCSSMYPGHAVQAASASTVPGAASGNTPPTASPAVETVVIPGPLRSFERMAGISQEVAPADVMPLLARKIYMQGYEKNTPTEFLLLIDRYLQQARELQFLAGASGTITVKGCDDAGGLIRVLGYRLRQGCGQKTFSLETANATRAFLTIDSGFPLVELEEALQSGTPFVYPYPSSKVPVLFHESDWVGLSTGPKRGSGDLVDILLSDPWVARLYWSLSQEDSETRMSLQRSPGVRALLPYAGVLEFYGSQICIRSGHVIVPGGASAQAEWKGLVGASPDTPAQFVLALLAKDKGWLAAYFDTLSRVRQEQQKRLTESPRLKRVYDAFRAGDPNASPTQGVFRKNPDLLVLFTRIQWDSGGGPRIPGSLEVWKEILRQKTGIKAVRDLGRRAQSWDRPEQLFEGMAGLAQVETDTGPLQMFLLAIEIDRQRQPGNRLSAATLRILANNFSKFNTWYQVFTEFPDLDDASITRFVNVANSIDKISNRVLRANTEGSFQATLGLWQILARQGQIPNKEMDASWMKVIEPFAAVSSPSQLFDASRSSLGTLLAAAGGSANASQSEIVELLAGPRQDTADSQRVHKELAGRIGSVLEDQRLVSLDTLFALSDGLKQMAETGGKGDGLLPLAAELREFDLPQPIFTQSEKISWAPPIYTDHHAELQVKTDLTKVIKGPGTRVQLETARGQLAPFLRDTLVGLNYAYYEPPDAQMLHHNPLFVRSHDFLGISVQGSDRLWGAPRVLGVGTPAGGGAYLMGSLSDLSYALATTEEDFIAPRNIQALILKELAPVLMVSATVPRWWNVTPNELHAVSLYQRSGEELLSAAVGSAELKAKVIDILSDRIAPQRLEQIEESLTSSQGVAVALAQMAPAETSYLAVEMRGRFPEDPPTWGPASQQLEDLRGHYAAEVSWDRISRDFGVPHPTLAQTNARELLNVKPFPFFGSYSSRLFGETWESSNLYWARLADEMGYSPATLNSLVPELTRRMIANTFATDLDDWPAVLRAMQRTGEEFRRSKAASVPAAITTLHGAEQLAKDAAAQ
jgi:hypothetical protein